MQLNPEITFRNLESTPALAQKVRQHVQRLERHYPRIMGCRVAIESRHRHHHKGKLYHVRIDVTVPGNELVVSRDAGENHAHEDTYVAIRDAFVAMERQLDSFAGRQRGDVKLHETPDHGRVSALNEDHGFLVTPEGRSIYFHRNSVVNGTFEQLQIGNPVRFVEASGEEGPQASTLVPLGKHHPVG